MKELGLLLTELESEMQVEERELVELKTNLNKPKLKRRS